jgi:hypothetical protein
MKEFALNLPWLSSKPERAIFDELSFACVYAVGPTGGRPLRIGWARQLKDRMAALQLGNPKELVLHECIWTAGDMLAIRIFNETAAVFDKAKRRLMSDWFDVTPELAQQAIRLATDKLTIPTFSHGDMLQKVRAIRRSRIDAAVRAAS